MFFRILHRVLLAVSALLAVTVPIASQAANAVYMTEKAFLDSAFTEVPAASTLWLKGDVKSGLQSILDRKAVGLRQRYWQQGDTTAWIFNEIGKELPITIGVVVQANAISQISVLVYRESRGGEVRHDFFTRQFNGAGLNKKLKLDRRIDGITGATLSVRSMQRVAGAALYLDAAVVNKQ